MLTARVCPRAKKWGARGLAGRALCQTAALVLTLGSSIIILEKGTEVCWPALACDRARHASSRRQPPFIAHAARSAACTSGGQCSLPRRVYMYARPPPPCQQMSAGLNTTTRRASHPLPAVVKTSRAGRRGMRQGARSTALLPGMLLGACLHYSLYLDLGLESGLLPNGVLPKPLPDLNGSTWSGMSGGMVGLAPSPCAGIPGKAKRSHASSLECARVSRTGRRAEGEMKEIGRRESTCALALASRRSCLVVWPQSISASKSGASITQG